MRAVKIMIFVLWPVFSMAQVNPLYLEPSKKQADSLRVALGHNMNDTLRMAANRELALYYLDINSDSAIFFVEQEIPIVQELQLKIWEADALDLRGIISSNRGNYVQAIKSINDALRIVTSRDCEKNIWNISKFTNSTQPEYARLSLLATIYSDVAGIYSVTGNRDKQLSSLQECIAIATRINDNTLLSQANRGLGLKYYNENRVDSALACLQRSLDYADAAGYNKYRSNSYNLIGRIYLKQNLNEQAHENILNALRLGKEQNNNPSIARGYNLLSNYYDKTGHTDSALYYAKLSLRISQTTGEINDIVEAYGSLVKIYKDQNRPDSALVYLQLANTVEDSLLSQEKIRQLQNIGFDEQLRLQQLEKETIETQNRVRVYALLGVLAVLLGGGFILFRNNRQKQRTNKVLEKTVSDLKATQSQLIQAEKMASLGELTAGIAHEIQNPLNFVNNFSEVNTELIEEMEQELSKGHIDEAKAIAKDIRENEQKINYHGKRADSIVKGMLQHSRNSNGQKELTDINVLADECMRLSYHGLRAKDKTFNAKTETAFDNSLPKVNIVPQDIGRVVLNLFTNAFYSVMQKKKQRGDSFEPVVTVRTSRTATGIAISIRDNGNGIPQKVIDKIFQPFFTTKPVGEGTGLGLSMSYEIITKGHAGELKVDSKEGEYAEFTIILPI